jgi:hypothetical protein
VTMAEHAAGADTGPLRSLVQLLVWAFSRTAGVRCAPLLLWSRLRRL